jgi:hypothetical protein
MPFVAIVTAIAAVVACVAFHLATFVLLTRVLDRWFPKVAWWMIGALVLVAISAHICEITLFAGGIQLLEMWDPDQAPESASGFSVWYRSASAYTALGSDQPSPRFAERWLTAVEALTGLILISWTASFLFLEMQKSPAAQRRHRRAE